MPTLTLRSADVLHTIREHLWDFAMQTAVDYDGDSHGSEALYHAVRMQDVIGWPHQKPAASVAIDDAQAAAFRDVLLESIGILSEVAADSRNAAAGLAASQEHLRALRRALRALTPEA